MNGGTIMNPGGARLRTNLTVGQATGMLEGILAGKRSEDG